MMSELNRNLLMILCPYLLKSWDHVAAKVIGWPVRFSIEIVFKDVIDDIMLTL